MTQIKWLICLWVSVGSLLWAGSAAAQRWPAAYSKEEPIWLDFDMASISEPANFESGYAYDFLDGEFFQRIRLGLNFPGHFRRLAGKRHEAYNVNTLDEVPDSSWFTNRNGRRRMSLEEIRRGPNENDGPLTGTITVVSMKATGVQPGFLVRDQLGDLYSLKFDPPEYPDGRGHLHEALLRNRVQRTAEHYLPLQP